MKLLVKDLSFQYRLTPVLKNICFQANPGDLLCVLGPNGVGKSTLFRCILGMNRSYRGEILVDGKSVKAMKSSESARMIAYIPQSHHPTFNFPVLSVVMMGMTVHLGRRGIPKREHEEIALEALRQLGIAHLSGRGYAQISGGERQLVLIARALVQQAPILIMDEPTANLDYGNQLRVMERVERLASEGYTIILSTHNPEHAFVYGNQMLMIYDGAVIEKGAPKEKLTGDLIRQVYGVSVGLHDLEIESRGVRVIVPHREDIGGKICLSGQRKV